MSYTRSTTDQVFGENLAGTAATVPTGMAAVLPLFADTELGGYWLPIKDGDARARAMYERHYSARPGRDSKLIVGPGEKLVLLGNDGQALFLWRKFHDDSGQWGVNAACFRNESGRKASDLIAEAEALAWHKWPGERLYTYVNPGVVQSTVPGYCFRRAGWRRYGLTDDGLLIFEKYPPGRAVYRHNPVLYDEVIDLVERFGMVEMLLVLSLYAQRQAARLTTAGGNAALAEHYDRLDNELEYLVDRIASDYTDAMREAA